MVAAAFAFALFAAIGARADPEFGGPGGFDSSHPSIATHNIIWITSLCISLVGSICALVYVFHRRRQQRKLWADAERNGMAHQPTMMAQNPHWVAANSQPGYGFPPSSQQPHPEHPHQQQLQPGTPAAFVLPAHPSFSSSTVNHVDPSPFSDSNGWRELQASGGVISTDNLHDAKDKPQRALSMGKKPGEMETEFQFPKRSMSDDEHSTTDLHTENKTPDSPITFPVPEPASVPLPDDNNERRSSEPEVPVLQITSPDGISGGFHFDDDNSDDDEAQEHDSDVDEHHDRADEFAHHRRESSESDKQAYPPGLPIVTVHAPPTDPAPDNRHV